MKNKYQLGLIVGLCLCFLVGCSNSSQVPTDDFEAIFADEEKENPAKMFQSYHHLKTIFPNTAEYVVLPYHDRINQFKKDHSEFSEYYVVDKEGLLFARLSLDNFPEEKLNLEIYYTRGDDMIEDVDNTGIKTPHWILCGNTSMKNTEITKEQFTSLASFFEINEEELFDQCHEMVIQSKENLEFDDVLISMYEENGYVIVSLRKELETN